MDVPLSSSFFGFVTGLLPIAGPFFFLGMQASAVHTALTIRAEKTVRNLSLLPFLTLLVNCVIWSFYGMMRNDMTVLLPNGIGILTGSFCVLTYHQFASKSSQELYILSVVIVVFATCCAFFGNSAMLGSLGCVISICVMGSPLATIRNVLQEKSTASLPFFTSLTGWCNSLSWTAYGLLLAKDPLIYGPNLAGLFLTSTQMLLFAVFGFPKTTTILPMLAQTRN